MAKPLISPTRKTVVIDRGWNKISRELRSSSKSYTKVGLPANGKTSGRYSMSELIDVGYHNEFGAPRAKVPERSFIRTAIDENAQEIAATQFSVVRAITGGQMTILGGLEKIGAVATLMIKNKIKNGPFVGNKPSTVKKKGFDWPLVETTQLHNSIQHEEVIKK